MNEHFYIACDLGAGSGRVMLGQLKNRRLTLDELHRFASEPVKIEGTLRWNVMQIFEELKIGLRKVADLERKVESVSVNSWGVDYVLLGAQEPILDLPYHYRDARTEATFEKAMKQAGPELIFNETGVQFMPINTLYQLLAEVEQNRELVRMADLFLNIADYFHFLFCGVARAEESLASTTQLYDPRSRSWSKQLIDTFALPARIFPALIPSGTRLGALLPQLQHETGLRDIAVIATCSHDTAAAVAAVPAMGEDWAFLSSGTWSLMGVELPAPLINDEVRAQNFTNEGGYGGTTRFLKNMAGMWLLQECQRVWQQQGQQQGHTLDYDELTGLAGQAEPFRSLINPNSARFARPDDMPQKISAFCRESGQPVPETVGQTVRCVLESLALLYRTTLTDLQRLTGRTFNRLHIVGGGSQNALLNQFAADATGRTVLAGPVEATAAGNVLIQALTLGHLDSLQDAREIVRDSLPMREFQPDPCGEWPLAALRFDSISSQL